MSEDILPSIPDALSRGPALHALVRVVLTNGMTVVGRIATVDPQTMNVRLEGILHTAVRRIQTSTNSKLQNSDYSLTIVVEENPAALRCLQSIVVRGSHIQYLDFLSEYNDTKDLTTIDSIRTALTTSEQRS